MSAWSRLLARRRLGWHRDRHLSDDALLDALLPSPSAATAAREHLSHCETCQSHAVSLSGFLSDLGDTEGTAYAQAFPTERLATQRARIIRRLRRSIEPGTRARMLCFPGAARPSSGSIKRTRWVCATATAALLLGVALGQLVHFHPDQSSAALAPQAQRAELTRQSDQVQFASEPYTKPDDQFLDELEIMLSSSQVPELRPLDEITPGIRDVAVNIW